MGHAVAHRRDVVLPGVDEAFQVFVGHGAAPQRDHRRCDEHAGRRQHDVPQVGPPRIGVPDGQAPFQALAQDRRHAVGQADEQAQDAGRPVDAGEDAHEDDRHEGYGDGAGQPEVEGQHPLLDEGHVGESQGHDEGRRDAPHPGVVGVGGPLHDEPGVDVPDEEARYADADGVEGGVTAGDEAGDHQADQPVGQVGLDHQGIGLVDGLESGEVRPGHGPHGDVEPEAYGRGGAGHHRGHLEVPLGTGAQEPDGLVLVDDRVHGQHHDEAQDDHHRGDARRRVAAHVEERVRQRGVHGGQALVEARPSSAPDPDHDPQHEGSDDHGHALDGVGEHPGLQPAADDIERRRRGHGHHDEPAGGGGEPGEDAQHQEHGEEDVGEDVGAGLDVDEDRHDADGRPEAVFQPLGVGEDARPVHGQDDEEGEHEPADGDAEPPLGELGQAEQVRSAGDGHVVAAVHGRAEGGQADRPPGHGLGRQVPVEALALLAEGQQAVHDDAAVDEKDDGPV